MLTTMKDYNIIVSIKCYFKFGKKYKLSWSSVIMLTEGQANLPL